MSPQIRRIQGLESLLQSLSIDQAPDKTYHVVYPWSKYSKTPGQDISFWYSGERCQYGTLRRVIFERFNEIGHPTTDELADALVLAFLLMPGTGDALADFEKILKSFTSADVSQYILIPASSLIERLQPDRACEYELIGFFGHGPFEYAPFLHYLKRNVRYRFERIGLGNMSPELEKFVGHIALHRVPRSTQIIDFARLGLIMGSPPAVTSLIQYYFDDLADALFETFWKEHLESQQLSVAAGGNLLDRALLEALPGTAWLSIFWGFQLFAARGMISFITETTHFAHTLAMKVHSFGTALAQAQELMKAELADLGPGPHGVYPSLLNFGRLVTRSRELQSRGYIEESFTLLMVAMESLLADRNLIERTLSRRAAAVLAIAANKSFGDSVKLLLKLYDARSKFVHQGKAIAPELLEALQGVCRTVFFAVYRSQASSACQHECEDTWKNKWLDILDYISACFDAGVTVDSKAASFSGALSGDHGQCSS